MEPQHEGLVQMIFLFFNLGDLLRFYWPLESFKAESDSGIRPEKNPDDLGTEKEEKQDRSKAI